MNKLFNQLSKSLMVCTALMMAGCGSLASMDSQKNTNPKAKTTLKTAPISYGTRPFYLVDDLKAGELKDRLLNARSQTARRSEFSIAHRGAPLQFPEHTKESYLAAHYQGAGVQECDVAFTKDHQLVCRHSDSDLHTTTNILATPLAAKCTQNFVPATFDAQGRLLTEAAAKCLTTDITLAEFKTLKGKQDAANPKARTVEEYLNATPAFRTDLYSQNGTLMSLDEALALFKQMGVKVTPELKQPSIAMPHAGYSYDDYRKDLIEALKKAGYQPKDTIVQSFNIDDLKYWIKHNPDYASTAVFLMDESNAAKDGKNFDPQNPATWKYSLSELQQLGIKNLAPATWMLVTDHNGKITASDFAKQAKKHGFGLITWTVERSGLLSNGGGYYYTGVNHLISTDSDVLVLIDVLAKEVGVKGIFSDWPATVSLYANAHDLP